jgi:hypothetical protein
MPGLVVPRGDGTAEQQLLARRMVSTPTAFLSWKNQSRPDRLDDARRPTLLAVGRVVE